MAQGIPSPFEGKEGVGFELIITGKNLIDFLETTIEEAGSKNGTVMIEFVEGYCRSDT